MPGSDRSKNIVAYGLAALALALLALRYSRSAPHFDKALHVEIGRTLAAESLKLLKPGGKLTIIARDTTIYSQPAMAGALAALQHEFRRAGAEVRSIELIQLDPLRPAEVPSGDFYELLRRLPQG